MRRYQFCLLNWMALCLARGVEAFAPACGPSRIASALPASVDATRDSASDISNDNKFMFMTKEQDMELKLKGDREAELMSNLIEPLMPPKISRRTSASGGGGAKGFGGGGKKKKVKKTREEREQEEERARIEGLADVIARDGIVRIDNVLDHALCDELKQYLVNLRARGISAIEEGRVTNTQERFADVLLNQNRCDLKIPLGPRPVSKSLHELLTKSIVRPLIEHIYNSYQGEGSEATLWELNCFMSNSGSRRQLVHFDTACTDVLTTSQEPIMLTCFVSLQDIDETMGPTTWLLGTHNPESHAAFLETDDQSTARASETGLSSKESLLQSSRKVVGTLPKGSCAIFDPRTLHNAGENTCADPTNTRALFYVSFKNPKIDHPGSPSTSGYGIANADLSMQELVQELELAIAHPLEEPGTGSRRLDLLPGDPS